MKDSRTVSALAASVGCSRVTWYSWEAGANIPSAEFMAKLRTLTGGEVTADDFYPDDQAQRAAA